MPLMTDMSPEDHDLIDRYLANRLTESEVAVVETRIVADPGFRNEVELTEALRDGLRELQSRGEIAPLLSHRRSRWRHPRFALAASVAAITLGAASFLFYQRLDTGRPETVIASLRFEHTRGSGGAPDFVWQQTGAPTRLQLQFDVGLEPAAAYRVVIERLTGDAVVPVLEKTATMTADGMAVIVVESTQFDPGDYEITLHPQPQAGVQVPVTYALRISAQH